MSGNGWRAAVYLALACGLADAPAVRAELIKSGIGLSGLGAFEGQLTYSASNGSTGLLTITLTNTSPADNGGYITAFVFNNPGGITGATLSAPGTSFQLLGSAPFDGGINGAPFGQFDLGASTGGGFEGGGKPSLGLAVGVTGTFNFTLTGSGLDGLTAGSFLTALSDTSKGGGEGAESIVVRFRGFKDRGSDKVPGVPGDPVLPPGDPPPILQEIPEPGTLALGGLAALLGAGCTLMRGRRGGAVSAVASTPSPTSNCT